MALSQQSVIQEIKIEKIEYKLNRNRFYSCFWRILLT